MVGRSRRQQRSKAQCTKSNSLNERSSGSRRKTDKTFLFSFLSRVMNEKKKNSLSDFSSSPPSVPPSGPASPLNLLVMSARFIYFSSQCCCPVRVDEAISDGRREFELWWLCLRGVRMELWIVEGGEVDGASG